MESFKTVERDNSVGSRECRRKPALPQELRSPVRHVIVRATAVVDIHRVDSRVVEDHETRRSW